MSVDVLQHLPDDGRFKLLEEKCQVIPDLEASFSVRLFPEGFSIGKPLERAKAAPPMGMLYPYNRTSERFLRALDGGWIPGDLLEDIPCKYVNGCIACEVLDYCVNAPSSTDTGLIFSPKSSMDVMPVVYKITLKPTTESIVKDVSLMVDETWTYKDLMEVESKILKTTWPELHLDPKSTSNQTEKKAMLRSGQKIFKHYRTNKGALMDRRLRLAASVKAMVKGGSLVNSKKIAFEVPPERLTGEANLETVTTNSDVSTQSAVKSKTSGPMGSIAQFPLSPTSSMSGTRAGHEPTGITMEKQLPMLGRRDARDFGGIKLDTKKIKQDSPRLEKFPLHIDKSLLRSDHKTDQEQDIKAAPVGHQDALELMKLETQLNSDQQRIEDSARVRDEKSGFGVDSGQAQHHDPQLSSQRLAQQDIERQSWQVLSPVGDRDSKHDDLLQRRKFPVMPQKPDGRVFQQSLVNDIPHMSSGMAQNVATAVGASNNPSSSSSTLIQPKDQLQVSGTIAGVLGGPSDPMQQLPRRRTTSLPKNTASVAGVASPGSTINSGGMPNVNSPSTASMPSLVSVKSEGSMVAGPRKDLMDTFAALLSMAQRIGLPQKKRKVEPAPASDSKKTSPSWQLLLVALANTSSDDVKDPKGQRNMADSLVGGNVNVRKTRFLQFQRQIFQGSHYRRVRVRLVMCERGKDAMVEAVVQFGDDQDDEMLNSVPHHVLPTMANAHAADIFAKQFCALLEKEGFELVEDQVQPTMPRGNATAASAARPLPAGASTLGNSLGLLPSPRSLMNPHMSGMGAVSGMPGMPSMQPSSPSALAATRMPPPGNASNRQMSATYLGQSGVNTSSKPLQLDGSASQLAAVQHPQQHQSSPHLQRAQQMVMPTQLAQLNHNSAQQINQQMVASQGQLQQYLQRQQAQTTAFQRKLLGMGSLGPMGNLGGVGIPVSGGNQGGLGNMVGVNAMNNVVGMSGISNVSASMGSISGLNNVGQLQGMVAMGQNTGLGSLIGRSGNITAAQMAAFTSKTHLAQGRSGHPVGAANPTARENLTGLNAPNQVHVSAGLPMMGQPMSSVGRVGLTPIQRAAPVGSLGSPRVTTSNMPAVAGQGMYLNPSQQVSSQQQFNLQQLSPLQQNGQQQPMNAPQLQLTQSQQLNTQVQQQNPPQQVNLQQPKNTQQALNPQTPLLSQTQQQQPQPQQQQLNPQGQINSASQQHTSVGGLGSLVGGPASPQLSSQNVGSVTSAAAVEPSITNCSAAPLSSG